MHITTREAKIDDLETLYRIELECFEHEAFTKSQLAYFMGAPRFVSLAAEVNGGTVGFIIGSVERYKNKAYAHIYSLDVSPSYRRRGVASKLLEEAERIFAKKGAKACHLEVRTDNVAALRLYRKYGYLVVETLRNYYKIGVHGFRLKKDLLP